MGIDYSGGMIVGAKGSEIPVLIDEDFYEELIGHGMTYMSEHYDAGDDHRYYGYLIDDILVSQMDDEWLRKINELASKFEEITGVPASLIGTQDIY